MQNEYREYKASKESTDTMSDEILKFLKKNERRRHHHCSTRFIYYRQLCFQR